MHNVGLTNDRWPAGLRTCLSPFLTDGDKQSALADAGLALGREEVVNFLERHQLLAFAGRELHRLGLREVASSFRSRWITLHARNLRQAKRQRTVMAGLQECARESGAPLVNLRTPYLVELAYGADYGARGFRDIDLAVPPKYVGAYMKSVIRRFSDFSLEQYRHEEVMLKATLGSRLEFRVENVPVDLHWDLALLYNFQRSEKIAVRQEEIWARVKEKELPWGLCQVLHDVDLLLHLAEHLVIQHDLRSRSYRGVLDFARVLDLVAERVDMGQLLCVAQERGVPTALKAAAVAAEALFQTPEDHPVRQLARTASKAVAIRTTRQLSGDFLCLQMGPGTTGWRRVAAYLKDTVHNLQTMATFMDGSQNRRSLLQNIMLPRRDLLSYAGGRSLRRREWLLYLLLHPFLLPLAVPAVYTLARRQLGDFWQRLIIRRPAQRPSPAAAGSLVAEPDKEPPGVPNLGQDAWVLGDQLAEVLRAIRARHAA